MIGKDGKKQRCLEFQAKDSGLNRLDKIFKVFPSSRYKLALPDQFGCHTHRCAQKTAEKSLAQQGGDPSSSLVAAICTLADSSQFVASAPTLGRGRCGDRIVLWADSRAVTDAGGGALGDLVSGQSPGSVVCYSLYQSVHHSAVVPAGLSTWSLGVGSGNGYGTSGTA